MSEKKYVITVSRQFGSLGRPIARKLAEQLGIKYYDRDIVDMTAKKMNMAGVGDRGTGRVCAGRLFPHEVPSWNGNR